MVEYHPSPFARLPPRLPFPDSDPYKPTSLENLRAWSAALSAHPLCVGLVHGQISDKTGNGLAVIVPSKFIVDVILKADAKKDSTNAGR